MRLCHSGAEAPGSSSQDAGQRRATGATTPTSQALDPPITQARDPWVQGGPTSAAHTALRPMQLAGAVPSGDVAWGWTSGLSLDTSGESMTKPAKMKVPVNLIFSFKLLGTQSVARIIDRKVYGWAAS